MLRVEHAALLLLITWLSGCQFNFTSVEIKPVNSSVQKPSNVAVYVAIEDGDVRLADLDESNFAVYENGTLIEQSQAQLTLLERESVAVHHVLLLLDLSGDLDVAQQRELERAAGGFVQSVTKYQGVSVYGFDGSTEIKKLGEFPAGHSGDVRLSGLVPGDPSRNLNGAAISALKHLNAHLMRIKRPVRVGTLVVFARGPDVAARETSDTVYSALSTSAYNAFAVGVKSEQAYYLDDVGPAGKALAESPTVLGPAFIEAARLVNDARASHYLIQYCSPARAGKPIVRLEVRYVNQAGEERTGDVELGFDASRFGPGCDPRSVPTFQVAAQDPWNMDVAPEGNDPEGNDPEGNDPEGNDPKRAPPSGTPPTSQPPTGSSPPPPAPLVDPAGTTNGEDDEDAIVPPPNDGGYE